MHSGHRERLRKNIDKLGIFNLDELHILEYLLTFVIPRADTNPIAHSLLKEFGSIDEIFNANLSALMNVNGVGEQTARFLRFMAATAYMYNKAIFGKKPYVGTLKNLLFYLKTIIPPSDNEQFVVLILNKNYTVKQYKIFKGVSHALISLNINDVTDYLLQHKTNFCIFAHTHPHHSSAPSVGDIETFEALGKIINALSIVLVENVIIGEEDYYSLKQNKIYLNSDLDESYFCNSKKYLK